MTRRVSACTLGCKVNQYDTEAMLEAFEREGYESVAFPADADVYIINTCTVTGTGDQKSRKLLRRIAREHPNSAIVAAGCLAQRDAEALLQMENVRLVIGVQRRAQVVSLLEQALLEGGKINAVSPLPGAGFEHLFVSRHEGKTRATMKIQEGCDRYCAYCIIPSVRGPVRSMPLADVAKEAKRLAESGYREIVVTGIHLGSYGRGTDARLMDAIQAVHDAPGVMRVRLGSLEPMTVTEEFARRLSQMPGLMRQFHISLQSGSQSVLERMRRRYTPKEYMAALLRLRDVMPDCAVTTDVIAGFPGETEEEFQETCAFLQKAELARIHAFPYSRRSGTLADKMPDQVCESVKKQRTAKILEIGNKLECAFVQKMIGTQCSVLFEEKVGDNLSEGYSGQYVRVRANGRPGEICNVQILRTEGALALGEVIDQEVK